MIKQIVDSIVEAEASAEAQITLAQENGRKTIFDAQNEAESLAQRAYIDQKEIAKQFQFASFVAAEKKAEELIDAGKKKSEKHVKRFQTNMPKAVDFVVRRMIDKCQ